MKVKVLKSYLDEENDVVRWEVCLPNGQISELFWPREQFGKDMKIKDEIPIPLLKEFCTRFVNKEVEVE